VGQAPPSALSLGEKISDSLQRPYPTDKNSLPQLHMKCEMCEGPPQKLIDAPPPALAKSQTHPPAIFLVFGTFWGVSRQGEFKNTTKIFLQKVHVENFSQNFDKNFDVTFSSTFFCFIAFSGVFQRWEFKSTTKKRFPKQIVSKSFYKKFDQKSKTDFFLDFCLSRLGVSR
jgi:hypothetical protein